MGISREPVAVQEVIFIINWKFVAKSWFFFIWTVKMASLFTYNILAILLKLLMFYFDIGK